jgi:acyl-CoA hydrolase
MEVGVEVFAENQLTGKRKLSNTAFLTFVAVDEADKPVKIEKIVPQTKVELDRYNQALQRRKQRLAQKNQ